MKSTVNSTGGKKLTRLSTLAALVAIPAAALTIGVSPSLASPITALDNSTLLPELAQAQTSADRTVADALPKNLAGVVDRSTVRVMAENTIGTYSLALDATGQQVCVISQMKGSFAVTGATCARKEKFAQDGASIGLQGAGMASGSTVVYLLPDSVDTAPLKAYSTSSAGPLTGKGASHILVETPVDSVPDTMDLRRTDSSVKFGFQKLHMKGR